MNTTRKPPFCLGLTGSIGMGKSTAAQIMRELGAQVFCADIAARRALEKRAVKTKIKKLFPQACRGQKIVREILAQIVFQDEKAMKRLEKILHPEIEKERKRFYRNAKKTGAKFAVFDIPLLFETGGEKYCGAVACVSAPARIQKTRVLKRKNMTPARLRAILKRQMPDTQKRKCADFVLFSHKGKKDMRRQVRALFARLERKYGRA